MLQTMTTSEVGVPIVKGKANSFSHTQVKGRDTDVPIVIDDDAFMNDDKDKRDDSDKGVPTSVLKDNAVKTKGARAVPNSITMLPVLMGILQYCSRISDCTP